MLFYKWKPNKLITKACHYLYVYITGPILSFAFQKFMSLLILPIPLRFR